MSRVGKPEQGPFDSEDGKRAEEALRDSEHHWRSLTEGLPQLVWSAAPDGACTYFSTQWTEHTGIPEEELLGWRWMEVLHPDDREPTRQFWTDSVAGLYPYDVEYRVRRQDGEYRWFKTRGLPVRDGEGKIVKWFGTCTDISDRKRVEEALRKSEQELRNARDELEIKVAERTAELERGRAYLSQAQRLSRTGSLAWRVLSGEIYWSEETYNIFEFDQEIKPTLELVLQQIHPSDRDSVQQTLDRASKDGKDFSVEFRLLLLDGSVKYLHILARALETSPADLEFVGAVMDITERKRADEERERLHQAQAELAHLSRVITMGELTASLAHEIKQPISAAALNARTCLRWLERDQPNLAEASEAAARVIKDVMRAADTIGGIGKLFKKDELQHELVDINELIREMIVLLRNEANRYSISIRTELAEGLPNVMAERVQLQQVLMNLMLNGIDAMKETTGRAELTIKSKAEQDQLLISVSDTGVGLPPEHEEQIFNAFFTTKDTGTGMGLSISRSIIESHGGRLWASNTSGQGATFQFTLPGAPPQRQPHRR